MNTGGKKTVSESIKLSHRYCVRVVVSLSRRLVSRPQAQPHKDQ